MLLSEMIKSDPGMEVVGNAASGEQAISLAEQLKPDLITMDIHMPDMNGFEASQEIMVRCPTPIVIVTASTNFSEVNTAMDALRVGALAAITKPAIGRQEFETEAKELIATLKAMAGVRVVTRRPESRMPSPQPSVARESSLIASPAQAPSVLAIGASTGGPGAVAKLLSRLDPDFPIPILLVQHITSGFSTGYAKWLDSTLGLDVKIAQNGEPLRAGSVFLAPDDYHLEVTRGRRVATVSSSPVNGFRPSCSVLFSSIAEIFGASTAAVILTGMGDDGVSGLKDVHHKGGTIYAQDEASSVVFGMPKVAIEQGYATGTPIELIAANLNRFWLK